MNLRIWLFLHSEDLNLDLSLARVSIKDNTFAIAPNLYHNANNLPLWTWWQPKIFKVFSPFFIKGKGLCSPWLHAKISSLLCWPCSPWLYTRSTKSMFFKKNQDLYIIKHLPMTKRLNTYIHHPTKWGSSSQPSGHTSENYIWKPKHYIFIPGITGKPRKVITWPWHHKRDTIREIHDIETKYLEQDLWESPLIDSSNICQPPFSLATKISFWSPSASVPLETNKICKLEPKASKVMPTMHY